MLKIHLRPFHAVTVLTILLLADACSDNTSDPADLSDLSGIWELSTTITANTCGKTEEITNTEWMILVQCSSNVSVISGNGLCGSGVVQGDRLDFSGIETETDDLGCIATHRSEGFVRGTPARLEGRFSTKLSFETDTCSDQTECALETISVLTLVSSHESGCTDRDEFGNPSDSEYILPFPKGERYTLNNSYCIPTGGHRQQMAYDFLIPVGDTISAARAGVVRKVKENAPDNGQGSDHNHVMIEHEDGTVGFYAHLKQNGVLVEIGENVASGQAIAFAGHSGTTDVAHLHFGVYDDWPPVEGNDRAVNFRNTNGPLDCRGGLVNGASYTAQ